MSLVQMALDMSTEHGLSEEVLKSQTFGDLVSMDNFSKVKNIVYEYKDKAKDTFLSARQRAKATGVILAHFLASPNPIFSGQSITLSGYSLGSAVCKAVINRLGKLDRQDIIHNCIFWAGATCIKAEKYAYQRDVFSRVVNGRIMNVYSKEDGAVLLLEKLLKKKAIGRQSIF